MKVFCLKSKDTGLSRLAISWGQQEQDLRLLHGLDGSDLPDYLHRLQPGLAVPSIWKSFQEMANCRSCETLHPVPQEDGVFVGHQGDRWEISLLSPRPPKVSAVGLNYHGHAHEQGKEAPSSPMFFAKARTCLIGPSQPIVIPSGHQEIDVEVELVVIIGRDCYQIQPEQAKDHILGYTIGNDVSDREAQRNDKQFYRAKSFGSFGPLGPCMILANDFEVGEQRIQLWLNDQLHQDARLNQLIFSVPELVSRLSWIFPLERGELLFTGTPQGVGAHRNPPIFLKSGDRVRCSIEGIGTLENPVK